MDDSPIRIPHSELDTLTIRPVRPEDAEDLHEAARHPDAASMILLLPSMELAETEAYLEKDAPGRHFLVAEWEDKVVGNVVLTQAQNPRLAHSGTLGLTVHYDYWGQGIGTRLMAAILDVADNWLNLKRVELGVFAGNDAAIHIYEKSGFVAEGTQRAFASGPGGWMDHVIMARLRNVDHLSPGRAAPPAQRRPTRTPIRDLEIRPIDPDDTEALYEIFRHPAVDRTTLQLPTQEIRLTEKRIADPPPGMHRYVAVAEGRAIGNIALIQKQTPRLTHAAGLGMMVHPDYWGRGIGSRLMETVLDLADNWLNLKRVELDVNVDNPAGVRLYEKFGFVVEGTRRFHTYGDGRWADSHFMARIQDEGKEI